jgi:hypothetical protein
VADTKEKLRLSTAAPGHVFKLRAWLHKDNIEPTLALRVMHILHVVSTSSTVEQLMQGGHLWSIPVSKFICLQII